MSAAPILLHAQPLTAVGFARFGHVLAAPDEGAAPGRFINSGNAERFDLIDDLQLGAAGGRPMLALFRAQARRFPIAVADMERHALGSQSFVPLGERRFVIVVAAAGTAPTGEALSAFITDGRQGVTLAPGTWHHALLAVDAGDFVVVERAAAQVDCDVCTLARQATVLA